MSIKCSVERIQRSPRDPIQFCCREVERDVPNRICSLSCISSPTIWITVVAVKSAVGLEFSKNVYCTLKCENQKVKSELGKGGKEIEWDDAFVFYRKYPDRPVVIKVRPSF